MISNFSNAQNLVEIEEIRQNTVILKSGKLLQILMVDGLNFSLKSEEEQNIIVSAYQDFLNGLGFSIQVLIHSRKINVSKYLALLEERRAQESSALLQNQTAEYREFIRAFVAQNPIMTKTFFAAVPFSPTTLSKKVTTAFPFIKKKEAAEQKAEREKLADFTRNLMQLEQRVTQVSGGLSAIGLEVVRLNDQALIELFYNFYNPETTEREGLSLPSEKSAPSG